MPSKTGMDLTYDLCENLTNLHTSRSQESPSPTPTLSPNSSSSQTMKSTQAYNGTFLAATAYSYSADPTYFLIYQNANGDIQKVVYNGAGWQKPVYITDDARLGTGLTTAWLKGTSDNEIWIYYIDKANKLQELRGAHGSDTWKQGTLGKAGLEDATPGSVISMQYVGDCASGVNAWLCYQTPNGTIRQISWNAANDSWTSGVKFPGLKPQSGFVTYNRDSIWRVFAMDTDSHVVQYDCVDCCRSVKWNQGTLFLHNHTLKLTGGLLLSSRIIVQLSTGYHYPRPRWYWCHRRRTKKTTLPI